MSERKWRFISLGAGVQSTTLALMAAHGEVPMPDAAVFADTQWEPRRVYQHLDWLEQQLPFPVVRVTAGSLRDALLNKHGGAPGRFAPVPFFLGQNGGMGRRQCTREFKLLPLFREFRRLAGYGHRTRIPAGAVRVMVGISLDEAHRMRTAGKQWMVNEYPLIDARMTRGHCLEWMRAHGYPHPPKSSCIGCPYHSDDEWRAIKANPEDWLDAVEVDRAIRDPGRGMRQQQFMHRSRKPLDQVDLSESTQADLWGEECLGMCGL